MKKRIAFSKFVALASIVTLFSACDKVKDAVKVNVPMQMADVTFSIPAQQAGTQTLAQFNVIFNVDSAIKANASSFSADNIKSAKIESCKLTLLNGTDVNNFAAIAACQAVFSSNINTTPTTLAAIASNPDTYAATLDLPVNGDVELKDYFKATSFSYLISGTTRKAITTTLQCKATIKFNVEVGL